MATHKDFRSAFKALEKRVASTRKDIPAVIGNLGTRIFVESFKKEAWNNTPWKIPQRRIPGTKAFKYPRKKDLGRRTRKTLVKSGALRREVNNSLKTKTFKRIEWLVSGLPYAKAHNEGLNGMPKRKFIGDGHYLRMMFKRKVIQMYKKTFA
jgi:hypothetical protein